MSLILHGVVLAALPGLAVDDVPAAAADASPMASSVVVQEPHSPRFQALSKSVPPALQELPTKQRLSPPERVTTSCTSGSSEDGDSAGNGGSGDNGSGDEWSGTAVFSGPAHFPLPEFGAGGERFAREALVIYEGMTVSVDPQGKYEVRFVAQAPKVPVTVRLQLHLQKDNTPIGTITLPPITLTPSSDPDQKGPSESWLVTHKGYAHRLRNLKTDGTRRYRIRRTGTARFGAVPE